jgi:pilus assembly protein Flp/PilA
LHQHRVSTRQKVSPRKVVSHVEPCSAGSRCSVRSGRGRVSAPEDNVNRVEVILMVGFLYQWMKDNAKRQDGQAMAEYGLILALIAVVCILALTALGLGVSGKLGDIASQI